MALAQNSPEVARGALANLLAKLLESTRCVRLNGMPTATITENNLRKIVTESVHGALNSELMKFRALALHTVSQKEQREIEKSLRRADRSVGKRISITI